MPHYYPFHPTLRQISTNTDSDHFDFATEATTTNSDMDGRGRKSGNVEYGWAIEEGEGFFVEPFGLTTEGGGDGIGGGIYNTAEVQNAIWSLTDDDSSSWATGDWDADGVF